MAQSSKQPGRLRLACEFTAERVIAARGNSAGDALEVYASRALPPGTLLPSLTHANVAAPEELAQAVAEVLGPVAAGSRDVVAVIPDIVARITLLDFDSLPGKREEADAVVRFRLKKSLPFDPDTAIVSYHAQRADEITRVVAAVVLRSVLEEYEAAIRAAGFHPGIVLPSTLAALGPVGGAAPALVVKVDPASTTLAIVDQDELRLFRTLEDSMAADVSADRLAENIHPSLAFYEDTYNVRVPRVLVAGLASADRIGAALAAQISTAVEDLVGASSTGSALHGGLPPAQLAGVVGALVG